MTTRFRWETEASAINCQCQSLLALIREFYCPIAVDEDQPVSDEAQLGAYMVLDLISDGMDRLSCLAGRGMPESSTGDADATQPRAA
ncbi:MAG: hypothetical protein AAGU21_15440 [Solidesulfovibrio sp.]|uniref:hypothetical protein n=1 Tax=Solidesulfovibrio sp. TaxID=2910990 RepID=UPI003157F9A6